ncbi:MAG: M3 family peptidase, partial [Bdellovibrionales bacterium]|nr:M3 family peptidase [Bdellovibrionales bacterium]
MIKHSDHIFKNSKNPILSPSPLPHRAIPFTEIHVDHFLPALKEAIALAKKQMSEIGYQSDPPSFANTIEAMEIVGEQVDLVSSVFYNLLNAETSEKMQALAEEIGPLLANYSSDILLDTELFSRVKAVYESEKTKESSELNPEQRTLLEHSYLDFARNGAMLSSREKDKLREIDVELSKMGPHFNQNVLKATTNYFLHLQEEEDVAGLPDSLKVAAAETAKERKQEGWIFTLDAPSIIPFLK